MITKKIFIFLLISFAFIINSCSVKVNSNSYKPSPSVSFITVTPTVTIAVAATANKYENLSTSKGLELYVWKDGATDGICCGLLPGTNRMKSTNEFDVLRQNPINIDQMLDVLQSYKNDTYVFVIKLDNMLSEDELRQIKDKLGTIDMPNIVVFGL